MRGVGAWWAPCACLDRELSWVRDKQMGQRFGSESVWVRSMSLAGSELEG